MGLLLATTTWNKMLVELQGRLTLVGDAKGVLQAVFKRRAKSPSINKVVMEAQFQLGASMHDLRGEHVWSEANDIADALSRQAEGAELPSECRSAVFSRTRRSNWNFLTV